MLFKVTAGPTEMEFQQALAVVRSYLTDESGVTTEANDKPEAGTKTARAETLEGSSPAASAGTQLSVDGNVDATSFTGDGTNLGGIATDAELTTHTGISAAHHTKTVDTTCSGAACDGTNFTNIQWSNLSNRPPGLDDGDDGTTYAAGPGLALAGATFRLATGPGLVPMDNTATIIDSAVDVGHSSITLGADGLPVVSYRDETNGDLKVAKCADAACSSASLSTVDSTGSVGAHSSITLGADGLPIVSYYDFSNVDLKVAKCADAACSSASLSTIDSAGQVGGYSSITLGADGLPVVSYYDQNTNYDLKVAKCADAVCSSATLSTVDSGADRVGLYTSITLGADGLPVVSYYDGTNDDLKMAKCTDAACSSATLSTVDSAVNGGRYTSITLGADDLPVISYYDEANADLKVAKCHDVVCSSATLSTVDSTGDVGLYTSITLGADGLPVVSYYDSTNLDLKVAKCTDAACSSAALSTVDNGLAGYYTSITLGADGLPVVSYRDFNPIMSGLKVAHCGSAFCVPYLRRR